MRPWPPVSRLRKAGCSQPLHARLVYDGKDGVITRMAAVINVTYAHGDAQVGQRAAVGKGYFYAHTFKKLMNLSSV